MGRRRGRANAHLRQIRGVCFVDLSDEVGEEHYFTLIYHENKTWRVWNSYGNLKDFEDQYPGFFFRINRLVLINLNMILETNLAKEPYTVTMKGDKNNPLGISRSKRKLLAQLYVSKT
jgi:DNA-binding LytR/AlgR family response regulator